MHSSWTETLAEFLKHEPGVEAVRLDPAARKVSIATLGKVDITNLEKRLAETLAAIDRHLDLQAKPPVGFTVKRDGALTEFAGVSCATAPKFWKWREFNWPEYVAPVDAHAEESEWKELTVFASVCGVAGLAGFATKELGVGPDWLPTALYAVGLIAGGWDAVVDSWENIKKAKVDIHFLMLAVAVGAVAIGAWGEAVLLLFLFSASGAMEAYALDRTHREVSALLKSAPKRATLLVPGGGEREVPVEEVCIGDRLLVRPGEAFPADGNVLKGKSASDESALTGEAVPVEKGVGDPVFSGTLNLWGAVEIQVVRLPSESTLQKIIRLIQTAQKLRAPSERFTDKFGGGYTIGVLGVCAVMFLVWWLGFNLPPFANVEGTRSAFYRAMTLLVVMSPCALVLSIPSAILAAIAWGARHGVLFRGGAAIESLATINVVAMDKTGTLTTGELAVVGYESFPAGREVEIMELAFALESNSQHPLARAIVRDAKARGVRELGLEEFQSITGQGVRGSFAGSQVLLGRRELLEKGPLADWLKKLPAAPADLAEVWVVGKDVIGRVLLRDQIRAESKAVLSQLKAAGIHTVMLTGDRRQAAEAVAHELGLDEVRAGLSPEQKVEAIQALRAGGRKVAMVGDGVNDAPSLAAADVSVAMGARGSDAALEQAEVILMHDRIENFLAALKLSKRATRIIKQNLAISLGVVVIMAVASTLGFVPLAVGVAAHEGSTVVVCLNSLRLLFGENK
ncbi:MAG: heavy metal translocating P-type ATPase [Opitutus sp.]|nr:heavy metal translocating P-type ATPase [Opitutus sp.]MCS6248288.1 heavy metal translocating P-type ATPase [Opitutus sp.]MCS6274987.1 heavy metal translocating P-type ATPase [Opitutus sp.]MCS6278042.1 heavy metal translocating P-type ATPase [Opitutus sp.]MCS6298850.1 heavy metal translocating P-type ATPase [Opitutus sp.]